MSHLIFAGQPLPIDWPKVDVSTHLGKIPHRVADKGKRSGKAGDVVVYEPDPQGSHFRWGVRPFKDPRAEVRYVVFHHSGVADSQADADKIANTADTEWILVRRALSVHLGVDPDGTIVQLVDLALRDQSSGYANDRGVGVEIANIAVPYGGYTWQKPPAEYAGRAVVEGLVGGAPRKMWDYTAEQKAACAALAGALCSFFPRMVPRWPGVWDGSVRAEALAGNRWGILGHLHTTAKGAQGKWDPGPAFPFADVEWRARCDVARTLLNESDADVQWTQRALQVLGHELPRSGADGVVGQESGAQIDAWLRSRGDSAPAIIAGVEPLRHDLKLLLQGVPPGF